MPDTGRRVVLDGCVNFRDLGGLPAAGGRTTRRGRLFRSDALHRLSARDLTVLRDELGIASVLDLRTDAELETAPPPAELRVVRTPLFAELRPEWNDSANWETDETGGRTYAEIARVGAPAVVAVLRSLAAPGGTPAVVHCQQGRDRTGIVVGILLDLLGVDHEVIAADYEVTRRYLDEYPISAGRMLVMLRELGPAADFVRAHGATDEDVDAVRAALTAPDPDPGPGPAARPVTPSAGRPPAPGPRAPRRSPR